MSRMTLEEQADYDKAAARIAQAEREGQQELHLRGQYLTKLPPEIGNLTELQSLDISLNQLIAIPDALRELTQLQILNINRNQLTVVPDWLRELTQLQKLFVSGHFPPL